MRKTFIIFALLFLFVLLSGSVFAETKLEIHFFYLKTCPHCAAEEKFLDYIEEKYPEVKVNRYFVGEPENQKLLKEICEKYGAQRYIGLVPLTFVGKDFFVGFDTQEDMGRKIEKSIQVQLEELKKTENKTSQQLLPSLPTTPQQGNKPSLPFVGKINFAKYALPIQAIILGFLDGFNVCSLGALALILGLVLVFKQRKKVLLFGGVFLLTTAIVYGLLIILWYQLFSFLASYLKAMELLVGLLGIGGGIYFLKQFVKFKKQGPACEVKTGKSTASKIFSKIQTSVQKSENILLIMLGVFIFAAVITIVEFPCSAVIPVIFAGILSQAQISVFLYFIYLLIYLFFYLLDEIIVFLVAVFSMKLRTSSPKFVVWITLIEAIVLFALGFYYLLGPVRF